MARRLPRTTRATTRVSGSIRCTARVGGGHRHRHRPVRRHSPLHRSRRDDGQRRPPGSCAAGHPVARDGAGSSCEPGAGRLRFPMTRVRRSRACCVYGSRRTRSGSSPSAASPANRSRSLLLYDRVAPEITTAAVALERLAFAVIGIVIAALISLVVVTRLSMPGAWDTIFTMLIVGAVVLLAIVGMMARRRSGDYLGRLVTAIDHATGRRLEASRVIRFILDVEDVLLQLLRGDRRRLVIADRARGRLLRADGDRGVARVLGDRRADWRRPEGSRWKPSRGWRASRRRPFPETSARSKPRMRRWSPRSDWRAAARWRWRAGSARLLWAAAGLALYPRVQERRQ